MMNVGRGRYGNGGEGGPFSFKGAHITTAHIPLTKTWPECLWNMFFIINYHVLRWKLEFLLLRSRMNTEWIGSQLSWETHWSKMFLTLRLPSGIQSFTVFSVHLGVKKSLLKIWDLKNRPKVTLQGKKKVCMQISH
jgi:hypothetical protein